MILVKTRATLQAMRKLTLTQAKRIDETLHQCAQIVLKRSLELVPKDTWALHHSAKVVSTGKGFAARSYVEYDTPYAWAVHEVPATHEPPTQYKYLTKAVADRRGTCTALLKRNMSARIEGLT